MKSELQGITAGRIIYSTIYVLLYPVLILSLSGDWLWLEGWLFNIWFLTICSVSVAYLYRKDPALLAERFKKVGTAGQKPWDRTLVSLLVAFVFGWIIIMPLDAKRFEWTEEFPAGWKILGGLSLLLSSVLLYRSFTDNTFLSPLVRIQTERKQRVVSTGVYGIVRHPMYLGSVFLFFGAPLLMSSMYGLAAGVALCLLLAVRIVGEEKMLAEDLEGYAEYKKKVRYRLIPFVW